MTTLLGGPGRMGDSADQDLDREHPPDPGPDHAYLVRAEVWVWSRNREPPRIAADRTYRPKVDVAGVLSLRAGAWTVEPLRKATRAWSPTMHEMTATR